MRSPHRRGVVKDDVSFFRKVTELIPHPDYENVLDGFDVMVMKLEFPVRGVSLAPIKQGKPRVVAGDQLVAVGFGKTRHNETGSDGLLRKADNVTAVSWQVCTGEYYGTNAVRHDLQFCAGTTTQRTCGGDSGGPVLDQNGIQVGITSFGISNCDLHHPRIFTRVSYFADWIQETVCAISERPPPYCGSAGVPTKSPTLRPAQQPTKQPVQAPAPVPTNSPTNSPIDKQESIPTKDDPTTTSSAPVPREELNLIDEPTSSPVMDNPNETRTIVPAPQQTNNSTFSSSAAGRATAILNVAVLIAVAALR